MKIQRTRSILVKFLILKKHREKAQLVSYFSSSSNCTVSILKMQHLKNLKNFLTPNSNSNATTPSPTPSSYSSSSTLSSASTRSEHENNSPTTKRSSLKTTMNDSKDVEDETTEKVITTNLTTPATTVTRNNKQKPALFRATLQESTKRLTNLLHTNINIRSKQTAASSTSPPEQKRSASSKFLRSSSMNFLSNREANNTNKMSFESSETNNETEVQNPKPSKKHLLQNDQLDRQTLIDWLNDDLEELTHHFEATSNEPSEQSSSQLSGLKFMETNEVTSIAYFQLASHAKDLITKCEYLCEQIDSNAHLYDFSENVKANGYRSVVKVYDSCCRHLLLLVSELNEKKNTFFFQLKLISSKPLPKLNTTLKEFQAWVSYKVIKPSLVEGNAMNSQD